MPRCKVWQPSWVGHTLLGRTLYGADELTAKLIGQPKAFLNNAEAQANPAGGLHDRGRRIVEAFALCGGEVAGKSGRIAVHPSHFYRTWRKTPQGSDRCAVHKLTMRVTGANIVDRLDVSEDLNVNKNEDRFRIGRAANHFTTEFDAIAELVPLFERARQLTILLESVRELRRRGFEPGAKLRDATQETLQHFTQKRPLALVERLVL